MNTIRVHGMGRIAVGGAVGLALMVGPAAAAEEHDFLGGDFGGSLTLSTDYMFRSISNTSNLPQLQGDMNWSHSSGLYLGVWSTNSSYAGGDATIELDPYIGFAGGIGETGLSYDVGYWSYNYPGAAEGFDFDFWEIYGILSYSIGKVGLSGSVWYADNYFGKDFFDDVSGLAYDATVSYELPMGLSASARVGEQTLDETAGLRDQDYLYYDAGVTKTAGDFSLDLRWFDSDDVQPELAAAENADGRFVFTVTRAF